MTDNQLSSVLDKLGAVKDTMTVSRVFGESYKVDGAAIVPVATVRGGGGGGGGEGTTPGGEGTGTGAGLGFGVIVRPLGVYVVKDGEVRWQPDRRVTSDRRWAAPRPRRHPRPPSPAQAPLRATSRISQSVAL